MVLVSSLSGKQPQAPSAPAQDGDQPKSLDADRDHSGRAAGDNQAAEPPRRTRLKRNAFAITLTEDNAMAAAPMTGESKIPKTG